jgi:hypothetical protein
VHGLSWLPGVWDKLAAIDGYSQAWGVWEKGGKALKSTDPAGLSGELLRFEPRNYYSMRGGDRRVDLAQSVHDVLRPWVEQWLDQAEAYEAASAAMDEEAKLRLSGLDVAAAWVRLYTLWEFLVGPSSASALEGLDVELGPSLAGTYYGEALQALVTMGLQLQVVASLLHPTGDEQWDRMAVKVIVGMRAHVYRSVTYWCEEYHSQYVRQPEYQPVASGVLPRAATRLGRRPRYNALRQFLLFGTLMMMLCMFGVVSATPGRTHVSGSFRSPFL